MSIDLKRFDNFKNADLRSLEIISPTHIKLTVAVQDNARAFDWITLTLDFFGVSDAKLLEQKKLKFIDMSEGVTLLNTDQQFAFAIGACYNIQAVKNSIFYIIFKDLKYTEGQF